MQLMETVSPFTYYYVILAVAVYFLAASWVYVAYRFRSGLTIGEVAWQAIVSVVGIGSLLAIAVGVPLTVCQECTPMAKWMWTGATAFVLAVASLLFLLRYGRPMALLWFYWLQTRSLDAACVKAMVEEQKSVNESRKGFLCTLLSAACSVAILSAVNRWIVEQ